MISRLIGSRIVRGREVDATFASIFTVVSRHLSRRAGSRKRISGGSVRGFVHKNTCILGCVSQADQPVWLEVVAVQSARLSAIVPDISNAIFVCALCPDSRGARATWNYRVGHRTFRGLCNVYGVKIISI